MGFLYRSHEPYLPSETAEDSSKLPESFVFDEERLVKLRSDILNAINLDVCFRLPSPSFITGDSYLAPIHLPEWDDRILGLSSGRRSPTYIVNGPILESSDSKGGASDEEYEDDEEDSDEDDFARIPKISSISSTALTASLFRSVEIPHDPLRQSILDIVDESPLSSRWQQSIPTLAVQLARHNRTQLPDAESHLQDRISNPRNQQFRESKKRALEAVISLGASCVNHCLMLSLTEQFEIAPGQPPKLRYSLPEIARH